MSGKLDQSLDQIMQDTKPAGGSGGRGGRFRRPARRAATKAKAAIAAPAGGIQKQARPANRPGSKPARAAAPAVQAPTRGESKVIVSNLPTDVTEAQIKDYFTTTIGHVRSAMIAYGSDKKSRGIATIVFTQPGSAAKAIKELDGVHVDKRPMKIEQVLGAPQKSLADRMDKPKSVTKDRARAKTANKPTAPAATNGANATKGGRRGGKSGRAGRPKKKTAQELDAEMMDYFGPGENGTNGTAQPAAAKSEDVGMVVD